MDYFDELRAIVGEENVFTDRVELISYSRDMSVHQAEPDVVVYPLNRDHVVEIMKLATREKIPVTPRAAGTSVTGASLAAYGGIILNMCKMNKVKEVNKPNGYVICEPGIICNQLNREVGPNYFFPPDPGSSPICTLGGMVALNSSGVRAMKYGTTKDYVMGMEVVLPSGEVMRTGRKAPKSSTGYDLSQLFTGSEGTLGIYTELTMKIIPIPEYSGMVTASFNSLEDNGNAVTEILTSGIPLSTCEIMDRMSIQTVNEAKGMNLPDVETYLIMELDGQKDTVLSLLPKVMDICKKHGGVDVEWTVDPARRASMWAARSVLVPSLSRWRSRYRLIPIMEDIGVPISAIPKVIREIQKLPEKYGVKIATFGHVGDGNLHATFVGDPTNREEWDAVKLLSQDLLKIAMKYEGTISAEHGIGMAKSPFIRYEIDNVAFELMRSIKRIIDPNNIMNPGKLGFDGNIEDVFSSWAYQELYEDPEYPVSFGDEIDNEILVCVQCGFCRAGCPVFTQTMEEANIGRGRIQQAYSLMMGRDVPEKEVEDHIFTCTMCNQCKYVCPAGVNITDVIQKVRTHLSGEGNIPDVHSTALQNIERFGNPFAQPTSRRADFYAKKYQPSEDADTLLFLGCVASYQEYRIPPAMVSIMNAAGVRYRALGEKENCCGFMNYLMGTGFPETAEKTRSGIDAVAPKRIVTTCAGCYRTLKDLYPQVLEGWNYEIYHSINFVLDLVREGRVHLDEVKKRVAYHDPCDLGRHMKMYDEPRELLKLVPGLDLVEFPANKDMAMCCGGGGGLKGYKNQMSMDIALDRIKQAASLDAQIVVSGCPTCMDNLAQAARRLSKDGGPRIQVMDIIELINKALHI